MKNKSGFSTIFFIFRCLEFQLNGCCVTCYICIIYGTWRKMLSANKTGCFVPLPSTIWARFHTSVFFAVSKNKTIMQMRLVLFYSAKVYFVPFLQPIVYRDIRNLREKLFINKRAIKKATVTTAAFSTHTRFSLNCSSVVSKFAFDNANIGMFYRWHFLISFPIQVTFVSKSSSYSGLNKC